MQLSTDTVQKFQDTIAAHYRLRGRVFPWRNTRDPYHILVSEIMLQQTQADRVVPFFERFIKLFPTVASLAKAKPRTLLRAWQGLGYNRRALYLKRAAEAIRTEFSSIVPRTVHELESLPGVGKYTAAAVMAFAYSAPVAFIETNIRSVYLHFFFKNKRSVSDRAILSLVEQTLDRKNPGVWYQALMDYGALLKKESGNPNQRSKHYVKQGVFKGSRRHVRGRIISSALAGPLTALEMRKLRAEHAFSSTQVEQAIADLVAEGFLRRKGASFVLSE